MKIKLLPLLIAIAGIIMISGCIDIINQQSTFKDPISFYRSIFYPYAGSDNNSSSQIANVSNPADFSSEGKDRSTDNLSDAVTLLDRNLQQANLISMKTEEAIQIYKAEGKDVSRIEDLLKSYKLLTEEAKNYRALADKAVAEENVSSVVDSSLADSSSENIRKECLTESQSHMIQANDVLKELFMEMQRLTPGNAELNSTSKLYASGDGMVNLMGNFTLDVHVEDGEIAIPFLSSDSEINITGDYTFEEIIEMQDEVHLYHVRSADVTISGFHKAVMVRGQNITLTGNGEGYAAFLGNGTYSIEEAGRIKKELYWVQSPFSEKASPGEQALEGTGEY
jgi:hypothetical protein